MKQEFRRFGMPDSQRLLTGTLQLAGSAGLIVGFKFPIIGFLASAGLALMMLVAFLVRIKLKDGFWLSAPSLIFLALNSWICLQFYSISWPK